MRIITLSCMWGRHETVKKAIATWNEQGMIYVMVVSCEADRLFCIEHNIMYTEFSNASLTFKWQHGLTYIGEQFDNVDAVLIMGSDDMIEGYEYYEELLYRGYDYVAIQDAYILDSVTNRMKHWKGYTNHRRGEGGGAGRLLSKELLDRCKWNLWTRSKNNELDGMMYKTIKPLIKKPILISSKEVKITDIKDAGSITSFDKFQSPLI